MIRVDVKRSDFFNELDSSLQVKYFDLSSKKYITNIDTFYFNCFLSCDDFKRPPAGVIMLINSLKIFKEVLDKTQDEVWLNDSRELLFTRKRFSIYNFCVSKKNYYDIFFAESIPNNNTPRVCIQLRSIGLWTVGVYELIKQAFDDLNFLLNDYGLKIERTQENRIDYCYHTNSIQNPFKFYSDENLLKHLKTQFKIYSKVGRIEQKTLTIEYLSLGQRSSNNVFFRSYNKVREVIEENYKEFFIEYWYNEKLISYYDYWIYSEAYKMKRYDSIYKAMAMFYIKFGKDEFKKKNLKWLLDDTETTFDNIKDYVLKFMPLPTLVINIEFQTQRKFYYYGDKFIDMLPINTDLDVPELLRLFQLLDNRKIFLDYLTSSTVAFVKNKNSKDIEYLDFWQRLRSCKLDKNIIGEYKRDYSRKLNLDIIVSKLKSSLATLSLYKGQYDTSIQEDMSLLLGVLNDNDMKQLEDGTFEIIDNEYVKKKEKKKKALKSLLNSYSKSSLSPS